MLFFLCILGHQSQIKIKNNACGWQSMPNDIISPATRATPPDRRAIPDSEICCPRDGLGNRPVWTSPARHGLQVTFRSDIIFFSSFLLPIFAAGTPHIQPLQTRVQIQQQTGVGSTYCWPFLYQPNSYLPDISTFWAMRSLP